MDVDGIVLRKHPRVNEPNEPAGLLRKHLAELIDPLLHCDVFATRNAVGQAPSQ